MRELSTIDKAQILIRAATGERFGDGSTVTDLCIGYAEQGYGNSDSVVVFGNWNPKRFPRDDDAPLKKSENIGPRLADLLESIGAECEWLDEWAQCDECHRALRTQADSYSWKLYGAFIECGYVCADCMRADPEAYLSEYINNPQSAVTWITARELEAIGFTQWESNNPHEYENGWHPGQNDDPKAIMREIIRELDAISLDDVPDSTPVFSSAREIVFLISDVGQFDVHFKAFVREQKEED